MGCNHVFQGLAKGWPIKACSKCGKTEREVELEQQVGALKAANKQNAKEAWDAIGSDHDTADQALCEIFNRCTAVHEATAQQGGGE